MRSQCKSHRMSCREKIFLILAAICAKCEANSAVCNFDHSGKGVVRGQIEIRSRPGTTHFTGLVDGLTPGVHGFHVHQFGDLRDGCKAAGGHFNPFNNTHGAPDTRQRHIGDLGNIRTGSSGRTVVDIHDSLAVMGGPHTINGRAIVIHEGSDDLGLGGHKDSLKTGNAGGRVACCIIQERVPVFSIRNFLKVMSRFGLV